MAGISKRTFTNVDLLHLKPGKFDIHKKATQRDVHVGVLYQNHSHLMYVGILYGCTI